jgi:voltage-gated potassium channel
MDPIRRLLIACFGLLALTSVGTVGYMWVEDLDWVDALYMTVITMSTVGYGEVAPLDRVGKLFTIGLIISTVGFAFYSLTLLSEFVIEGRLQKLLWGTSMETRIKQLRDHVILCGYGRFGRVVADELDRHGVPTVVIEQDSERCQELERSGVPHVLGSAVVDEVLQRAGVERARAIVAGTPSDADNVFIALSARERNPAIRIHARGESDAAVRRLRLAGADQVISAYQMGGQRVAASILRPAVVDFLEIARPRRGVAVDLEEVRVGNDSALVGRTISRLEADTPQVRVVALKRGDEAIQLIPPEDTEICRGDHLVVIGASESLESLAHLAGATA